MSDIKSRLYQACRDGNKELALSLISRLVTIPGHNRLVRHDDWVSTPLHEACRHGWLDVVQVLIKKFNHGIDVTERLCLQSPLHISCRYGGVGIVIYLIKRGCNPILRDSKGKEPVDYAIEYDHIYIVLYLCKYCITSAMMLAPDRIITTLNILNKVLHDEYRHLDWKMSNGDSIVEIVCYSKLITIHLSQKDVLKLVNDVQARVDDKSSDLIPYLICNHHSCVLRIPSVVMMEWLEDTTLDPMKLVISCSWKTADGDTLLQLVCQSESCVSRISSTIMLKWLIDSTLDLTKLVPNYKTAEGNTLLQLICQSKLCVSCISSTEILKWLTDTTVDLTKIIADPDYKTAYGPTLHQLICQSELCVSRLSSTDILKWLINTDHDLIELKLVPNYKTSDGDTLLTLICQTESCVSRISSTILKTEYCGTQIMIIN